MGAWSIYRTDIYRLYSKGGWGKLYIHMYIHKDMYMYIYIKLSHIYMYKHVYINITESACYTAEINTTL